MVGVTDPAAADSLLQNAPHRVNSFIILLQHNIILSTLSTLIKTLSSDNTSFYQHNLTSRMTVSAVRQQVR